ncbi:hypothetical protein [Curtobacterium phage Parvaparticeps]|nr:hypothetical protein [Curtobacterium phage Parvaparticeps]
MRFPTTVWHRGALASVPPEYRSLERVLLPAIDLTLLYFGYSSLRYGSKIVDDITEPWFQYAWGTLVLGGVLVSMIGLIFIKPRLEVNARVFVFIGFLIYGWATFQYILAGQDTSNLTISLILIRLIAIGWRVWFLWSRIGKMEADELRKQATTP